MTKVLSIFFAIIFYIPVLIITWPIVAVAHLIVRFDLDDTDEFVVFSLLLLGAIVNAGYLLLIINIISRFGR